MVTAVVFEQSPVAVAMTMTANGLVPTHLVEQFVKAEAARIGKQTPLEVEHA